ncbi:MAG TPA: sugar phosphate isomerase/epimerase family protein [Soehngenia sp.]|jgi:Sugar phosphate isomerases/epimerases|nr:sugar phosphate isomerase/epimerase family protein [Soehngenia sp.]HPP31412.1 sugar phosphate isomerase/epimerase family protein [Soehngenia sp.]
MNRIIGVNSNSYHGFSIDKAIDGIKNAGFKYIELTATKGWTEHVFSDMSFKELVSIKEELKKADLNPFALSGHCNLMDKNRIEDFKLNIELAAFFGCKYIISSIGEAHIRDKKESSDEIVANNIFSLLPILHKHNIKLCLENHGKHGTGETIMPIINMLNTPYVMINYDTANAIFYGNTDIYEDIEKSVNKIGFMHIKDKNGLSDEWNFPALGKGYIDFSKIFDILEKHDNECPMSIEIEFTKQGAKNLDEVNNAVKDSLNYLREINIFIE